MSLPILVVLSLVAAVGVYSRLITWRHARATRRRRRHERALARAEPFALGLLDGDAVLPRADDAGALSQLLTEMAPAIAGESRHAIADYFLSSGAFERACAGLGDRRWPNRAEAAAALGDMCHERAQPGLIAALSDGHPEVRLAAARSLGRLRSRAAVGPLVAAVVSAAVPRAVGIAALLAIGVPALETIRALLVGDDPGGVEVGVDLLGQIGSSKDLPAVLAVLNHPVAAVRASACGALGRLGDPSVAEALTRMLGDDAAEVRIRAAAALAAVGDRSAAAALVHVAQTAEPEVALSAAEAVSLVAPDLAVRVGRHAAASSALRYAASLVEAGAA
jgi:HEAT repeat protein